MLIVLHNQYNLFAYNLAGKFILFCGHYSIFTIQLAAPLVSKKEEKSAVPGPVGIW